MSKPIADMDDAEREAYLWEIDRRATERMVIHGVASIAAANLLDHIAPQQRQAYLLSPGEYFGQAHSCLPGGVEVEVRVILKVPT